jgi:hypothetical protein
MFTQNPNSNPFVYSPMTNNAPQLMYTHTHCTLHKVNCLLVLQGGIITFHLIKEGPFRVFRLRQRFPTFLNPPKIKQEKA